ncbi:MAG: type II toxin-antitoxin system PemK/MazF family toxin [Acidobacteria bacterium]|nr:type II toxin-antitoxin system PemK/MazF family toxin [Acidobacteriota bacterium]
MTSHNASPRRGEIWTAMLGNPPVRHWVLVVSLDSRNMSERVDSVLIVPFGSQGADGPTTLRFEPGETGLPGPSWLKGHFITALKKSLLGERLPRPLAAIRMRQVSMAIQRAFDADSPPGKA